MPEVHDPKAYLETEARIIAEDDTHAVIAMRFDKSWIERNLHFLAAISRLACQGCKKRENV
ncbi:MAG: hypothetical protein V4673_14670 [Pseudomonadota bacterium]